MLIPHVVGPYQRRSRGGRGEQRSGEEAGCTVLQCLPLYTQFTKYTAVWEGRELVSG